MARERMHWFRVALQLKGSVIPSVIGRTTLCGIFGIFVSGLGQLGVPVALPVLASLIPNIVLGLLLVFRTNTAYDRFWEGRKCWGGIVNTSRNLARQIWITIAAHTPGERAGKIATLRLIVAFAVATKLHLRQEPINSELDALMPSEYYFKLQSMNHPPLQIAFWIGDYLQQQADRGLLDSHQLAAMQNLLNILVDALGGCERILRTPMPLAYAIHLKQLLLLYCLSLPFQMVDNLGWWTGPVVGLISFTLFGIEEIGIEIENPFGHDPNDLPLDAICATMLRNIEDLISLSPNSEQIQPGSQYNRLDESSWQQAANG
ncbi:bestrophin family protein [Pantanalinema rosaneae CENA516]|uniref:bestrophin family protein n=1 Tax=Pantanalinema rosaneae TaxID=1620701 RepID=UPI003D6E7441